MKKRKIDYKKIERTFESAMLLWEGGDLENFSLLIHRLLEDIAKIIKPLQEQELRSEWEFAELISEKSESLSADKKKLESLLKGTEGEWENLDRAELQGILIRTEALVVVLGKILKGVSVDRINPFENLKKFIIAQQKFLYCLAAVLLILSVSLYAYRVQVNKKHSLVGQFFSDRNLSDFHSEIKSPTINFDWGYKAPMWGFRADEFSARWTGFIQVDNEGLYEFSTEADDGVRLWIDNQLIIDDWTSHAVKRNNGMLALAAGPHAIRLEYYEENAAAVLKLFWRQAPHGESAVIPASAFFSDSRYIK